MASTASIPNTADRLPAFEAARVQVVVRPDGSSSVPATFPYSLTAAALILVWAGLNLLYLACDCPLDLAPDEAHYWHWSRHLDWSYYSKGPLIAWLIRGSCELFGSLSVRLVGTEMLAVRVPAVLSGAVLLAGLFVLAADTLRCRRAALAVVAAALTLPPIAAASLLMTIDPPFLVCWCWALVSVGKAVRTQRFAWWLAAGVCSALGVLAKYPMLLLPLVVAGFLFVHRREEFRRPGVWVFLGLTGLGCVPILAWNAAHGWVSFRHVLGQAGVAYGTRPTGFRWLGPVAFAAGQCGLLLVFWFVAFVAAGWRFARSRDIGLSLLWWATVPVWGVFLLASLRAAPQVNWPAAAYVGGIVLAVAWVREQLAHPSQSRRRLITRGLIGAAAVGLSASFVLRFPAITRPVLAPLVGSPTAGKPAPIRKLDPTCRLRGWRTLAAEVDRIRDRVRDETGDDPALAGMLWTTPGELAFYCRGHPSAYSFGLALADRHSQYDLWRPNPVADAQAFRGRSFVYVGEEIPDADKFFDRIEPPVRVEHMEAGVPVAVWTVWVGHGFRGLSDPHGRQTRIGY